MCAPLQDVTLSLSQIQVTMSRCTICDLSGLSGFVQAMRPGLWILHLVLCGTIVLKLQF